MYLTTEKIELEEDIDEERHDNCVLEAAGTGCAIDDKWDVDILPFIRWIEAISNLLGIKHLILKSNRTHGRNGREKPIRKPHSRDSYGVPIPKKR